MKRSTLTAAAVGAGVIAGALYLTSAGGPASGPGSPGPGSSCDYPSGPAPLPKSTGELVRRIAARIERENRAVNLQSCNFGSPTPLPCSLIVAAPLATAPRFGLRADFVTAICWRESRFMQELGDLERRLAQNLAIGPMQVKPVAFRDAGLNPEHLLKLNQPQQVQFSISAGLAYLARLRDHYGAASYCDLATAYHLGPTAFRRGERRAAYTRSVIEAAQRFSELATP